MIKQSLAALLLIGSATPAAMAVSNPYQATEQMCNMMRNGISPNRAWKYIMQSRLDSRPGFHPSPFMSLGSSIGSIIGTGITTGIEMRGWQRQVADLSRSICPEFALEFKAPTISEDRDLNTYSNTTDPSTYIPK